MIKKEKKRYQVQYNLNGTSKDLLNKLNKLSKNKKNKNKQIIFEVPDLTKLTDGKVSKKIFYMFSLFEEIEKKLGDQEKNINNTSEKITLVKFELVIGMPEEPLTIDEIIALLEPTDDYSIVVAEVYNNNLGKKEQFVIQKISLEGNKIVLKFT